MSLEAAAVQALVAKVPQGRFLGLTASDQEEWVRYVANANEPTRHDVLFYGCRQSAGGADGGGIVGRLRRRAHAHPHH